MNFRKLVMPINNVSCLSLLCFAIFSSLFFLNEYSTDLHAQVYFEAQ